LLEGEQELLNKAHNNIHHKLRSTQGTMIRAIMFYYDTEARYGNELIVEY
jgi:hypothetical protein